MEALGKTEPDENSIADDANDSISLPLIPYPPPKTESSSGSAAEEIGGAPKDTSRLSRDSLRMSVKLRLVAVMRSLPSLSRDVRATGYFSVESLLGAGKRHAASSDNFRLAEDIRVLLEDMEKLLEGKPSSGGRASGASADRFQFLLEEIHEVMTQRKRSAVSETPSQLSRVVDIAAQLKKRTEYLNEQIDLYRRYLENARGKTFRPSNLHRDVDSDGAAPVVGPFSFRLAALEKENIVTARKVDEQLKRSVNVTFTSSSPGVFRLVVAARMLRVAEMELDINRLLESRASGQLMIDLEEVSLNIDMLIHLLNKLFVLTRRR